MKNYNEDNYAFEKEKKPPYFEGWYFKHQNRIETIIFIVGRNVDKNGAGSAFIQMICETASYNINFPLDEFRFLRNKLAIKIGKNYFTDKGVFIDIISDEITIKGKIEYGQLTPLKYSIMGPFKYMPKMECKHEIISLYHKLRGSLKINEKIISFKNGIGYMKKDFGHSFPKSYTWLQCNSFNNHKISIVTSIAEIPFLKRTFCGIICVIYYKGNEYRLATYKGCRVEFLNERCIILKQGKFKLVIKMYGGNEQKLLAPKNGNMSRVVHESVASNAKFWLYEDDELVFAIESEQCSCELSN